MSQEILAIDFEKDVLHSVVQWLAERGYAVVVAQTAAEGMRHFVKYAPPVVLVEVLMPEKDGIECLLEIKRSNPEAKVIAMSGGGALERDYILQTAKKLGADDLLAKPFTQEQLCAVIEKALWRGSPGGQT